MTKFDPSRAFKSVFTRYKREIVLGAKIGLSIGSIIGIILIIHTLFAQQTNFVIEPIACLHPLNQYKIYFETSFNGEIDTPYQCTIGIEKTDVKEEITDCSIVFAYRNQSNNITGWDEIYKRDLSAWEIGSLNKLRTNTISIQIGPFPTINYDGYSGKVMLFCNNRTLYGEHTKKYYIKTQKEILEEVKLQPDPWKENLPWVAPSIILILSITFQIIYDRKIRK